ncbi:MAG: histidine triad nucleotide-binding protein [Actinomycetota bacterium]
MEDCLFCKFVSGEIKPDVVYENDHVLVFKDINPQAPVHVLLIPKEHTKDVTTLSEQDGSMLVSLMDAARIVAEQEGILESGYRLIANIGPNAGQSVLHLHFHLMGGRVMTWPAG